LDFILGYSVEAGCMSAHSLKWARDILQILEWTPDKSKVSKDDVMAAFRHDKKGKQNSLRMVLLKEPGKPCLQEVLTKRVGQAAERWLKQNDFLHERVTSRTRKLVSQRKKRSKVKA
jgi:3-dehydroquinate synthetase